MSNPIRRPQSQLSTTIPPWRMSSGVTSCDGHTVECVHDGYEALRRVAEEPPISSSTSCCPAWTASRCAAGWCAPAISVVMLTALGDETDRLVGFETGADDDVTKPFSPRELALRVRSVLRRSRGAGCPTSSTSAPSPTATWLRTFRRTRSGPRAS